MKKLLLIACALALGACAAQQSAMQSADSAADAQQAQASEDSAAARREKRKSDQTYVTSLERRDKTGSRIGRVRRTGEPEEDRTAGKRVETISGEQLEEIEERGGTVVIGGEG